MKFTVAILTVSIFSYCSGSQADEAEKNWELGIGVGSVYNPDYRGSDEYRSFTTLIPYVVYHGKFLQSDRDGARAQFFSSDNIDFSVSASAYISPDSNENKLRQGMPSLGSTLELGPSLNVRLTGEDLHHGWHVQLPVRAVFSIGGDKNQMIGYLANPQLVYANKFAPWALRVRLGALFGSNAYHDFYYSVAPEYVTAQRSEYDAHSGYSGAMVDLSMNREFTVSDIKTGVAFFLRYDNLSGVNYTDSPLLVTDNVYRAGLAFVWVLR